MYGEELHLLVGKIGFDFDRTDIREGDPPRYSASTAGRNRVEQVGEAEKAGR